MPSPSFHYRNTKRPELPGFAPGPSWLDEQDSGIGYDAGSHFVHLYQKSGGWWVASPGLTVTETVDGTYSDWITREFGASQVVQQLHQPGQVTEWVWRPGLLFIDQSRQALDTSEAEQRRADQSLHLLLDRLTELLLYIEPEGPGVDAYSLKTRELLILAATDVEDMWSRYLTRASVVPGRNGFTTNQYVKLLEPLHLAEYQLCMSPYPLVPPVRPFLGWNVARPTQSLGWYNAYNKTKHDKTGALSAATISRCMEAVAASVVMYCVRFSPYPLFNGSTPVASLAQHLLTFEVVDPAPESFYCPLINLPPNHWDGRQLFDTSNMHTPWRSIPLASVV